MSSTELTDPKQACSMSLLRQYGLMSTLVALLSVSVGWLSASKLGLGMVPATVIGASVFGVCLYALVKLRGAPREMGFTFGLKFLSVTAYKVLNVTLVLWLAHDLGLSREKALGLIAGWSLSMTIVTLLAGSIADALGLRRTLLFGVTLCLLCRLVMVSTTNPWVGLGFGLFPLAVGEALCTPVLVAALRRYSTPSQRSVAFSLFYAVMNFGFMVANFVFDGVREGVRTQGGLTLPVVGELSDFRTLLLVSFTIEFCMIPLVFLLREGVRMTQGGLVLEPCAHTHNEEGRLGSLVLTVRDAASDTVRLFRGLLEHSGFYRLLCFLLMIGFLKVVFNVMDYVLPPFVLQELGPEARVGRFNAINGILILILAPAIGVLTRKYSAYSMVVFGGLLTAGSFGFMVAPTAWFQAMSDGWVGHLIGRGYMELEGAVHPYYVMIVFWQILFSIGEAFYSPRVYEYAASIAPAGQEASYASLSYVPLLIGKLITGAVFGGLLEFYCPANGPRNPSMMWAVIGMMVLIAPAGLLVLRKWIRVTEEGREHPAS